MEIQKKSVTKLKSEAKKSSDKERALTVENDDLKAHIARIEKENTRLKDEIDRAKKQAEDADKRADRFKNLRVSAFSISLNFLFIFINFKLYLVHNIKLF